MNKRGILLIFAILILALSLTAVTNSRADFDTNSNNNNNNNINEAGELKVTPDHPFLVDGEWIEAKDLQIGDFSLT